MAKIHEAAPDAVVALVNRVMAERHAPLAAAEVGIATIMVSQFKNDEMVPCLKLHGAQCMAMVRLTRAAQRVYVNHDVELLIDACLWRDCDENRRIAIIDHELTHVTLRTDRAGGLMRDDRGRPKIRFKPDDFRLTGFYSVVRRNGSAAVEHQTVSHAYREILASTAGNVTLSGPTYAITETAITATFEIVPVVEEDIEPDSEPEPVPEVLAGAEQNA